MLRPTTTLLRTLAAPSRQLLAPSTLLARRTLTTTTTTPTTTPPTTSEATPQTAAATSRPPYNVTRTPSSQLRVYHLAKRGGNKKLTTVKGIEGNRQALAADLAGALRLGAKEVATNNLTGHVIVSVGAFFLSSLRFFSFLSAYRAFLACTSAEGMGWICKGWGFV